MSDTRSPRRSNSPQSRIAVIGLGVFSYANPSLVESLGRAFPENPVDFIDLIPMVDRKFIPFILNSGYTAVEFAQVLAQHPSQLIKRWFWTNYLFQRRSLAATKRIGQGPYLFSIQTQSLFDASTSGVPHFVYTDNTMLANLQYTAKRKSDLPVTDRWIARERQIYHNACSCFVMSRNVARSLVKDYGCAPEKVVRAYVGRNASVELAGKKTYDQKNILFVGVNWERKGGPELLETFRLVRRQVPDATLTIVGCSPQINEPGCQVVGRVPLSSVGQHYRNASVFCMPTRHEPFGIVFIEAMANKLPVLGTNVGAIPDFITSGENGFCVAPGDIEGLAGHLVRLLSDPAMCRRMGERGYVVSQTYSWDNVASIMRSVIQGTLSGLEQDSTLVPETHAIGVSK